MFVDIHHLTYAYSAGPPVFDSFSLTIEKGNALSVIGPSGCGKSTLLYLLSGLLLPKSSSVVINGKPITRPRPRTGLVLQDHGLLPWATVRQNMSLGWRIRQFYGPDGKHAPKHAGGAEAVRDAAVDRWLHRLGISELADKFPPQLSRGQRQRTAIGRTLCLTPDLLLLDEPFSALDAPTREELQHTVLSIREKQHLTYVIVTHDIDEALRMGQSILVLKGPSNREAACLQNTSFSKQAAEDAKTLEKMKSRLKGMLEKRS